MRLHSLLPVLVSSFACTSATAWADEAPAFNKTISRVNDTQGTGVLQSKDGGYIVTASGRDTDRTDSLLVFKFTAAGELDWETTLLDVRPCQRRCLLETPEGEIIVGGPRESSRYAAKVAKLSAGGAQLWEAKLNFEGNLFGMERTREGSILLLSRSFSPYKTWLSFVDLDGKLTPPSKELRYVRGGIAAAGLTPQPVGGGFYVYGQVGSEVMRTSFVGSLNADFSSRWEKVPDTGQGQAAALGVAVLADGIVVGGSYAERPLLERYNAEGGLLWRKFLEDRFFVLDMIGRPDGSFVVLGNAGRSASDGAVELRSYSAKGMQLSARRVTSPGQSLHTMKMASDGSFLLMGSQASGGRQNVALFIKTDKDGNVPASQSAVAR